jgi:superfamily II DNA/RNA helicase
MSTITPIRASSAPTFAELGVPDGLVGTLTARGIAEPFAIQALTLADGLAGRDLSGRAPTGSGKTLAFGIPLAVRTSHAKPKNPTGLVLVPTRELAKQVCEELEWLGHGRKLRVAAVYGGAGFGPQLRALRRGVDVLVACPGRLTDLLERKEVNLGSVEVVVVDEADRMADMGFLPTVKDLLDRTPTNRQTLLFSATLDGAVDTLVRRYQRDPVRHLLPDDPKDALLAQHLWWKVEREEKTQLCADVIRLSGPTIVFCKTKHGSDAVAKRLARLGVRAQVIHGNRSQSQRERALEDFARGKVDALIATDVVARGIHVDDVACVVNFDLPHDEKDYVHRAGRTARAGASGTIVTFVPRESAKAATKLQRALGDRSRIDVPNRDALASLTPDAVSDRTPEPAVAPAPRVDDWKPKKNKKTAPASRASSAQPGKSHTHDPDSTSDSTSDRSPIRGEIKWFDARRGFGFIVRTGADDLFVHGSEIKAAKNRRIEEGQLVDYEIGAGRRGIEAQNVRLVA